MGGRKCEQCGAEFAPSSHNQIYCQQVCNRRAQRKKARQRIKEARASERGPRSCRTCGVSIDGRHLAAVYCSAACKPKQKRVRTRPKGKLDSRYPVGACLYCGGDFSITQATKVFCCRGCNSRYQYEKSRNAAWAEKIAAHAAQDPRCRMCGERIPASANRKVYCSKRCGGRWHDRERTKKRLEVMRSMAGIHKADRRPQPVEAAAYSKPRRRYMVLTDTGRECRPEAMRPGESIAKFYVAWVAS